MALRDSVLMGKRQRDENGEWERLLMGQRQRDENDEWERFLGAVHPGDQIFCKRTKCKNYHHHGIYMGDSMVIHLRRKPSLCKYCASCRYIPALRDGRTLSCLDCFRANETCYIVRYRKVEPLKNLSRETRNRLRPGKTIRGYNSKQIYIELILDGEVYYHLTISEKLSRKYTMEDRFELSIFSTSKSADEVMKTALEDGSGSKKYNLFNNNCEHFAVFCKRGKAGSLQLRKKCRRILPLGIGRSRYKDSCWTRRKIERELRKWLQIYSPAEKRKVSERRSSKRGYSRLSLL